MACENFTEAVQELYRWTIFGGSWFTSQLYDLIAKADNENKAKLSVGFPHEVTAYVQWQKALSETEFFNENLPKDQAKVMET